MRRATIAVVLAALLAAALPTVASAASPTLYVAACGQTGPGFLKVKPRSFSPGCAGGSPLLVRLRWSGWGKAKATANGRGILNTCDPSCAAGNSRVYPAKLVVSRVRTCMAGDRPIRLYIRTRIVVRFPAGNPFGEKPGWRGFTPPDTFCQPIAE